MKRIWRQYCGITGVLIAFTLFTETSTGGDGITGESSMQVQLKIEVEKIGSGLENPMLIKNLRIEVARAGNQSERNRIREALRDENPALQYEAIEMAKAVRGSDMICGLAELLSDTNSYRSLDLVGVTPGKRQDDVVFAPPSIEAAKALAELVDAPPVPPIGKDKNIYTENDVALWRIWWHENKSKFELEERP